MEVSGTTSVKNGSEEETKNLEKEEEDWAAQYQAYLDEKETTEKHIDKNASNNPESDVLDGEDWAIQYAEYCAQKEKEFFEANRVQGN